MGGTDVRVGVMLDALSVSMKAKVGDLDASDVDDMLTRAEELLPSDDPVFRACSEFATMFQIHRRSPNELKQLGKDLQRIIDVESLPGVPGQERMDLNG